MGNGKSQRQKEEKVLQERPVPILRINDQDTGEEDTDMDDDTPKATNTATFPTRQEWLRAHSKDRTIVADQDQSASAQSSGAHNVPFVTYNSVKFGSSIDQSLVAQQKRRASAQTSGDNPSKSTQSFGIVPDQYLASAAMDPFQQSRRASAQPFGGNNVPSIFTQAYEPNSGQSGQPGFIQHPLPTQSNQGGFVQHSGTAVPSMFAQGSQNWPLNNQNVPSMFGQNQHRQPNNENIPLAFTQNNQQARPHNENEPSMFAQNQHGPANNENGPSMFNQNNQWAPQRGQNAPLMFVQNNNRISSQVGFSDPAIVAQGPRRPLGEITLSTSRDHSMSASINGGSSGLLHPSSAKRQPSVPAQVEKLGMDRLRPLAPHHLHPSAVNPHLSSAAMARLQASNAALMPPPPRPVPQLRFSNGVISHDPNSRILLIGDTVEPVSDAHRRAYLAGPVEDRFRRDFRGPRQPFEHEFGHFHSVKRASDALQGFLNDRDRALASDTDVENEPPRTPRASELNRGTAVGLGLDIAAQWDESDEEDEDEEMDES